MGTSPSPEATAESTETPVATAPPRRHLTGAVALLITLLAWAGVAGYLVRSDGASGSQMVMPTGSTTPNSADAGFARDMQVHHAQAVEMGFLIRDRTDDRAIDTIAYDIITSQQQQMGQMYAWLETWGLPQTGSEPAMAWMTQASVPSESMSMPMSDMSGHDMSGMSSGSDEDMSMPSDGVSGETGTGSDQLMPGMATRQQMDQLRASEGRAAERLFLRLMIRHHQGGIAMAEAGRQLADTEVVERLAAAVVTAQTAEIDQMQQLLAKNKLA